MAFINFMFTDIIHFIGCMIVLSTVGTFLLKGLYILRGGTITDEDDLDL